MSKKRVWHEGPPPHVGWWNASVCNATDAWRWWDGKRWSIDVRESTTDTYAAYAAGQPTWRPNIKWTDYWPENARVPRVAP